MEPRSLRGTTWRNQGLLCLWLIGAVVAVGAYATVVFAWPLHLPGPCVGWFGYCTGGVRTPLGDFTRTQVFVLYAGPTLGVVLMLLAGRASGHLRRWIAPGFVLVGLLTSAYLLGTLWDGWPVLLSPSAAAHIARWAPIVGLSLGASLIMATSTANPS